MSLEMLIRMDELLLVVICLYSVGLKGIAHAGANGNREAVIAASWLEATHLMIDNVVEMMTDEVTILSEKPEMECAYLHTNGFYRN